MIAMAMAVMRGIIRLYPSRFRSRFGAELLEGVRGDLDRAARGGRLRLAGACARAAGDAIAGLIPEHRSELTIMRFTLRDDLRDAVRSLRQSPTFTAVALVVLAFGIGASTAIFSVVDAVVLRGLPFDRHDRILAVLEDNPKRPLSGATMPQNFLDWRDRQQSFASLAATNRVQYRIRNEAGGLDNTRGMRVTADFFQVLRVHPAIGRAFAPDDDVDGRHRRLILSHGFWQRRFGGAPDVVGTTLEVNDERWEIAGVMPRGFTYPVGSAQPVDLFAPMGFKAGERARTGGHNYQFTVIGRLRDDVTPAQAADDMNRIATTVDTQNPGWNTLNPGGRVRLTTLHELLVGRVRSWMLMLLGSVTLLLLIACANVANLMLARATVRGREMGLRAALGASRWRLTRGLLVEGVLLSLTAAAAGVLVAHWGVRILKAWIPEGIPRVADIAIDIRVLGATVAAAIATGVLFGIVPAFHGARPDLTGVLRAGGRGSTAGAGAQRLRSALVVVEVALAVILVVGAGLFTASFVKVIRIDPGFDYHGVLAVGVGVRIDPGKFEEAMDRGRPYVERMMDAVRAVPGVEEVAAVSGGLPLSGGRTSNHVTVPGHGTFEGDADDVDTRTITPNYLQVLHVPLLNGRHLTADDRQGAPAVALINQTAARKYWQGADPIGQRLSIDGKEWTVVGIVGDIRHGGPELPARPEAYMPMAQERIASATLVIRGPADPMALLPSIKAAIWSVNRDQMIFTDRVTLEAYMDGLIAQRRFNMALLALFGTLGLVISAVGIYGVMAYIVSQRTKEIGVRMALGASRAAVVRMVLANAGGLVVAGLAIGAVGAWYLSTAAKAFLFQLDAQDPRAFVAAVLCLAAAALLATAIPARRAAGVDPMVALRAE